ncbi:MULTISPECIES: alanyl-tRNA editing protein [Salinibaculum]|uniref:alanyl-tRNA editing protein n=1 Tax=Salinibaculum TaxID=2732368 RepID=UPI0030D0D84F
MTAPAAADPEVTDFSATVQRVEDRQVVLDETYFYPQGGGQPADRGVIGEREVVDVQSVDGEIRHTLAAVPDFAAGDTVAAAVDRDFRTYCMRAHTASHALYGAARRVCDDLGYGGFGIGEEKVRIDLDTPTTVDDDVLVELERLVNRAVWDSLPVTWEQRPRAAALGSDDVATTTTEAVAGQESVRVVEIEGWDTAVCGGTHVSNTREIGPVTVLDRSNPGEGLTRVEFAVGPVAIERRAEDHAAARRASAALDVPPAELDGAVDRLVEEHESLTEQVQDLREQVISARLSDLEGATVSRDGHAWLAGSVPTTDANALVEFAGRLVDQTADVVALVGEEGTYLAVATDGDVDASQVVDSVTAEFGGGGGGGPTTAQAGGLDADAEDVVAFLRGEN